MTNMTPISAAQIVHMPDPREAVALARHTLRRPNASAAAVQAALNVLAASHEWMNITLVQQHGWPTTPAVTASDVYRAMRVMRIDAETTQMPAPDAYPLAAFLVMAALMVLCATVGILAVVLK